MEILARKRNRLVGNRAAASPAAEVVAGAAATSVGEPRYYLEVALCGAVIACLLYGYLFCLALACAVSVTNGGLE